METIDARLANHRDEIDNDCYVMIGICGNCATRFNMLFSKGTQTRSHHRCPDCGVLSRFDLSKKQRGQEWISIAKGMRFACPICNAFWPTPVGIVVDEESRNQVIACPDCQKTEDAEDAQLEFTFKD